MKISIPRNSFGNENLTHGPCVDIGVSENSDTPKSSILIGFSTINHPFWGTLVLGNTHMDLRATVDAMTEIVFL